MEPTRRNLPPGTLSTPAASRIVGIPYRTLARWVERGVLCPELVAGDVGTQSATYAWTLPDVLGARVLRELRDSGLSAQRIRRANETIRAWGESFASVRLWTDGTDAFRVLPGDLLVSTVLAPGQHMVFPLDQWHTETAQLFAAAIARRTRAA